MNDFSHPTKQSIFAIILIIVKYIRIIIRQIWPFVIILFVGGSGSKKSYFLYFIIGVALLSMIWAIISYFRYFFYIQGEELMIEKGVLSRTKLNIPFDRIQSVNFQQNIIHQVLNVVKVDIDTAGSKGNEFSLDALSKDKANSLREIILAKRDLSIPVQDLSDESIDQKYTRSEPKELVLHLGISDLIKVGVSQNHLRSGGLIFIFFFWIIENLDDAGIDPYGKIENYVGDASLLNIKFILFTIAIFLIFSFFISLIRTVITNFDLRLWRTGNKYNIISGLFTRKETTATDQKIQILEWSDNPLKKLFKYVDVRLKQASSIEVQAKKSITIPGVTHDKLNYLKVNWLGKNELGELVKQGVSIHYFYRRVLFRMIFCGIIIFNLYFIESPYFLISFLLIPYFIFTSWLSYKKKGFAFNDELFQTNKGMFGDASAIMPLYKIQSVAVKQSPYQSRRQLASLIVYTASGSLKIPYIPLELANQIHDYFMFRIEKDHRSWI